MNVSKNTVVSLRQRVSTTTGTVIDDAATPIRYLHGGYEDIFAKIEAALDGKAVGDSIQVTLEPKDAFGELDSSLVVTRSLKEFETPAHIGQYVEYDTGGGDGHMPYRVTAIADDWATLDGNHPLAGLPLVFSATVTDVRAASKAEIASKAKATATPKQPSLSSVAFDLLSQGPSAWVLRYRIHSQTHKVCWMGPLYLLPVVAAWLYFIGFEATGYALGGLWLFWSFFGAALLGEAIQRWGEKFLFFDFSPNTHPSVLEQRIAKAGTMGPVLLGLAFMGVAIFLNGFSEFLKTLGAGFGIVLLFSIVGGFVMPFLIVVFSGFKVRPVTDVVEGRT